MITRNSYSTSKGIHHIIRLWNMLIVIQFSGLLLCKIKVSIWTNIKKEVNVWTPKCESWICRKQVLISDAVIFAAAHVTLTTNVNIALLTYVTNIPLAVTFNYSCNLKLNILKRTNDMSAGHWMEILWKF